MSIRSVHHTSLTVSDLQRTVAFYRGLLGLRLMGTKRRVAPDLGDALLGPSAEQRPQGAEILIADMALGDRRLEFIQYVEPASGPFHGDPSLAGGAHIALLCDDIEAEYDRLTRAGVRFHTPPRTVQDPGKPAWRWCYFRDPDCICVELVQSGEEPAPD